MIGRISSLSLALSLVASVSTAQGMVYEYEGSYDDAAFAVENAIVNAGLVIDNVSHVGDMLNRTAEDVGSDVKLFEHAQIFTFCSALVSREVMEADPANLVHCPYGIYVAERDGAVTIGHRDFESDSMKPVQELLSGIVEEALSGGF